MENHFFGRLGEQEMLWGECFHSFSSSHKFSQMNTKLVEHCTGIAEVMGLNPIQA